MIGKLRGKVDAVGESHCIIDVGGVGYEVNDNARATLKLGQARGMAMLAPAMRGIRVHEYPPNLIKKSVVGAGHADKKQIQMMVKMLLPKATFGNADEADALAIAICHAHQRSSPQARAERALREAAQ